jgi:hypothetical protein
MAGQTAGVGGLAGSIAVAAAARGSRVELVAKLGDDPAGDQVLLALNRARVGHAAVLRDPARPTPIVERDAGAAATGADDEEGAMPAELLAGDPETERTAGRRPGSPGLDLAPQDLELALQYLTDATVIVLADPVDHLVAVATEGAAFAGAALVIAGDPASLPAGDDSPGATILAAPADDPGDSFPALVADYAAELDAGRNPAAAWDAATRRLGAERT